MNMKRLVMAGIVASVLFLTLDAVFGIAGGMIANSVFGIPSAQPDEGKLAAGLIFELINGCMLAVIYAIIHPVLAGVGWKKGVGYGLIVWALRVVMWAFSTYMMTDMAPVLISITVVTGLIEMLIICVVIAAIYPDKEAT